MDEFKDGKQRKARATTASAPNIVRKGCINACSLNNWNLKDSKILISNMMKHHLIILVLDAQTVATSSALGVEILYSFFQLKGWERACILIFYYYKEIVFYTLENACFDSYEWDVYQIKRTGSSSCVEQFSVELSYTINYHGHGGRR